MKLPKRWTRRKRKKVREKILRKVETVLVFDDFIRSLFVKYNPELFSENGEWIEDEGSEENQENS